MDISMKCRKAGMEEEIMSIKSFGARLRRETFQTQFPMWNCSWLPWRWKIISAMDTNMKFKKAIMEEGTMPIKSLQAGWRREKLQKQYSLWDCLWIPWKWKNNFCEGYQYKIQKCRDGEGNNAYKIFTSRVEEGYIPNTISYVKLFMNTLKIKIVSAMDTSMKCEKARTKERITPIKSLCARWRRDIYANIKLLWNCS